MDEKPKQPPPHVLLFPLPYQGPMNSMFKLAELLCLEGLHVTFVITQYIHRRLLSSSDGIQSRFQCFPGFQLQAITDGLPDDHVRSGDNFMEVLNSLQLKTMPLLKEMLISASFSQCHGFVRRPVTCFIVDGLMGFTFDLAEEIGIPIFSLRTASPCCLWTNFCLPQLVDSGELLPLDYTPTSGDDIDVDALVKSVPGTESFLRRRDLPRFSALGETAYESLQHLKKEGQENRRAHGLILNTFEELDGTILSHLRATCPNLYAIGPLHANLKTTKQSKQTPSESASSSSLWAEDRSCMAWLDLQPLKSVIYVSFGSIAILSEVKLMELWHGLVNSGVKFLWVIRPESIVGKNWESQIPVELSEGTKQRGCIVGWAPQEEVLAHPAVGGFLTHSGWNSTLESIYAGVPMLCWPYYMDQQVNSRFVSELWKLGLDMKDTCERSIVEKTVKELMVVRRQELSQRADEMAKLARKCLTEEGSSFRNFRRLIRDIESMIAHDS